MRRRVLHGIGANIYSQGVMIALQLATVPGFLHAWGATRFGVWVTLTAGVSALSLSDCGLTVTAANAMTMAVARSDTDAATRLFAQSFRFVLAVSLGLAALLGATSWLASTASASPGGDDLAWTAAMLGAVVLAGLHLSVLDSGMRANGDYALGSATVSSIRLTEAGMALAAAVGGGGLVAAAAAMLATRCVGLVVMASLLKRRSPWVQFSADGGPWRDMRRLVRPAVAALAVPAGLALSLQGITVVAGLVTTAGAVAVLVAARTVTRVLVQGLGLFNHALMPEMSVAAGRGNHTQARSLIRLNLTLALATLLPGWLLLVGFGPTLLAWWTGGVLRIDAVTFALLATAALGHGAWMSAANLLLATNRQADYAYRFVAVAAGTCVLATLLGAIEGLRGVAFASLCGELAMVALVLPGQIKIAVRPALQSAEMPT